MTSHDLTLIGAVDASRRPREPFRARHLIDGAWRDSADGAIVFGVLLNAGECCNPGSRVIAHADVAKDLLGRIVALSRRAPFGDPLDEASRVGAIIAPEHQARIGGHVRGAVAAGATLRLGGGALTRPGTRARPLRTGGVPGGEDVQTRIGATRPPWVASRRVGRVGDSPTLRNGAVDAPAAPAESSRSLSTNSRQTGRPECAGSREL